MSKKQKTLFESWNKSSASSIPSTSNKSSYLANKNVKFLHEVSNNNDSYLHQSTSSPFQQPKFTKIPDELADPEFDYEAGKTWIYPTNYPIRDYQFSIVQEALYKNTLVVLPTGLGKTFIAAVVMYNIYRWYPNGKVVFMAPTRPLVAQQVNACFNITGISEEDTTQMTGTNKSEIRKKMWQKKRVFFLTPQVLVNDLVSNICPASTIKCLVIDEAHKALGNHAYCQVVKELLSYTSQFRVLALTATPGSETPAVRQVLANLLISHVELRSEDSEDVKKYSHIRDIEKIVVPLGPRLNNLKNRFLDVINMYLKRLALRKVMPPRNPGSLSKFQILNFRELFSKHPPASINSATYGIAMADFSLCISLYHAYELLLLHGAVSFYNYLSGILNGDKSIPHARSELLKNSEFNEIMESVKESYIPDTADQITVANGLDNKRILPSHPKLDKLVEVVLRHFEHTVKNNITDTRVMIFTQYRDSVQEIVTKLSQYQPTVKVTSFVGQSSKSSSSVGYSQKQQLEVIKKFRSGGYNTLVSTCVGEEGLDIGQVDLIVCFDCPKSPIRLVQRIGRTGRLRNGRIIMLVAEGKEEQMFNSCEHRKKTVYRAISKGFSFAQFYQNSPSLIPPGVKPVCAKTVVTVKPKKTIVKAAPKSPYLTDEEMTEFNQHVRVPQVDAPLLPKQEFVVLKSHYRGNVASEEGSSLMPNKPQLSLSDWTLWQTTPQRTDMIPHSSKSLLLVKILECIHFPELLPSHAYKDTADFADFLEKSFNTSKAKDLQAISTLKHPKVTEMTPSKLDHSDEEQEIILLSDDENEETVPELKLDNSSNCMPLIQQLFNITIPKGFKKVDSVLKSPPSSVQIFSVEELSCACIKSFTTVENKGVSILHVLNNKMKAKLRRKSKEFGRNIFFKDIKQNGLEKSLHISPKYLRKSEEKHSTPNISFDSVPKPAGTQPQSSPCEPDALLFDIDFDLPDPFEENLLSKPEDISNLNTLPHSFSEDKYTTVKHNEKEHGSNACFNKTSDFNVTFVSPYKNQCTVSKNANQFEVQKLSVVSPDNRENFLPNLLLDNKNERLTSPSNKKLNCSLNITEEIISNVPRIINMEISPKPSKNCNLKLSNTDKNVLDSSKSFAKNVRNEISELERTNEYNNLEVNMSKVNNFQNIPSGSGCTITNINLSDASNNSKSRYLLKEKVLNKFNSTVSHTADHKNSRCFERKSLSFNKSNEVTEIYSYSSVDNVQKNPNECSFNFNKDNKSGSNNESIVNNVSSESTKIYAFEEKTDLEEDLKEFDQSTSSLLFQLLSSQKNVSTDINTSISSPLTVKRCIPDPDKNENVLSRKKFCKTPVTSSSSCRKPSDMFNNSENFRSSNVSDPSNPGEVKTIKNNLDKLANVSDASQYTLTQLLSLIDSTETVATDNQSKSVNQVTNNLEESFEISSISSDDEVCPTPPKTVVKSKSNFIYNKKSGAKKPLQFRKSPSPPKNIIGAQKSNQQIKEISENQQIKETEQFENFFPERVEKLRSDNLNDSSLSLNEMDGKNIDLESSKITFDISFDLPFTQDFENSNNHTFDMNNAIIIDSPLNDSKLKLDSKDDSKFWLNKTDKEHSCLEILPSNKVNASQINNQNDNYLSDHSVEDSESLLTSVQINKCGILMKSHTNPSNGKVLPSKVGNSKSTCVESFNTCQNFSEQSSNDKSVKENFEATYIPCNDNHGIETTKAQTDLSSNKKDSGNFENTIFFQLLPDEYKYPKKPNSSSTDFKHGIFMPSHTNPSNEKVLPNKVGNSKFTCVESFKTCQNFSEQSSKNKSVKKNSEATLCNNSNGTATTKAQTDLSLNKNDSDDFENTIFFQLLPDEYKYPKKPNSSSTDFKNNNHDRESKTENISLKKQENLKELKETHSNSKLNYSNFNTKSKLIDNWINENVNSKHVKQLNEVIASSELLPEDILVKKVSRPVINLDNHNSVPLFEDKICFDINFEDEDYDKTCDILPKDNACISENIGKMTEQDNILNNENHQSCLRNSLFSKECNQPKLSTAIKQKENLKSVDRKSIFKKNDIADGVANNGIGKLSTSNDEIMWEFDLLDEDQNFIAELEKDRHSSTLHIEQEPTVKNADNNSSDEFDLQIPNRTSLFKKPNPISSNPIIQKHTKSAESLSSAVETKGKEKTSLSSKPSSKLSTKNNKKEGIVLNGNSVIDNDDEDFLFIQKVHKKIDKPSSKLKSKKKKVLSSKNQFLLSQAEVSGSEKSDHESAFESDDCLEGSFIDDETSPKFDCTDQHAFYLKSIKNCAGLPQQFKLKAPRNETVFLNEDGEYSMYQQDSFCVDDDEVIFLSSDDNEDYKHKKVKRNKGENIKNKHSKKGLKRVLTLDSSSSSDHDISPKSKKFSKINTPRTSTPDNKNKHSFIAGRKKKCIIISSDEENENVFNQPSTSKSHKIPNKCQTVENNLTNYISSNEALISTENAKFEFCVDFEDDDFLTLNDINKIEQEISMNKVSSSKEGGINASCTPNFSNYPATSKAKDSKLHSSNKNKEDEWELFSEASDSKVVTNFSIHPRTSSTGAKVSGLDKNKDTESFVDFIKSPNLKVTSENAFSNFETSNIPTMTTLPKCSDSSLKTIKNIETVDNNNEISDVSFDIFWNEIKPVANVIEDPSMNLAQKEEINSPIEIRGRKEMEPTILVDSRELASGKPVVSALRNIHKVNPVVMQLQSTDYILSNQLAVERVLDSEFNNCAFPPKIIEKIKEMKSIYDRTAVIIEKDGRKNRLSFNKEVTKYLKFVVYLNSCPSVKVLFSKSAEHTSELIAKLIDRERKKGLHINVPVELCKKRKVLYNFYSSFPKISTVCALNLMYYFPSIELFLKSSVKDIEKKGCISSHKAQSIFNFIHSNLTFHENL